MVVKMATNKAPGLFSYSNLVHAVAGGCVSIGFFLKRILFFAVVLLMCSFSEFVHSCWLCVHLCIYIFLFRDLSCFLVCFFGFNICPFNWLWNKFRIVWNALSSMICKNDKGGFHNIWIYISFRKKVWCIDCELLT